MPRRPGAARRIGALAGWWAVGFLVWLLMAATLARPDVLAAVAAGLVVAGIMVLVGRMGLLDVAVRLRWLRHLPLLGEQVLSDLVVLARVLAGRRPAAGGFRAIPFDAGDGGPEVVGRRALLTLATSLGPNTFVVGYDPDERVLLVHQLVERESVLPLPDGRFPVR